MSKNLTLSEFLDSLKDGLKEQLSEFHNKCIELRKTEADALSKNDMAPVGSMGSPSMGSFQFNEEDDPLCPKCEKLKKACKCALPMTKNSDYINLRDENDPEKRVITLKGGKPVVLPGDKLPKDDGQDAGSGGETKKLNKADAIPSAPKPPKMPKSSIGMSNPGGTPAGASKNVNPMAKTELKKEHIGFDKLKNELAHKKGVNNPAAVAAKISFDKYGKEKTEEAAHKGKAVNKLNKSEVCECCGKKI